MQLLGKTEKDLVRQQQVEVLAEAAGQGQGQEQVTGVAEI